MQHFYPSFTGSRLCFLPGVFRFSGRFAKTPTFAIVNRCQSININTLARWRVLKAVEQKSAGVGVHKRRASCYNNNLSNGGGSGGRSFCNVDSSSIDIRRRIHNGSSICHWWCTPNRLLAPLLVAGNIATRSSPACVISNYRLTSLSPLLQLLHQLHSLSLFSCGVQQRLFSLQTATMSTYKITEKGTPNTKDYKIYYSGPNGIISPFHDIPLYSNTSKTEFNMVVEIPRWTNHKMEICKEDMMNPIKQDVKNGKVRFVKNLFPHHGYIWNYGALPQTWEDPNFVTPDTNTKGDSDPIDVCEIGSKIHKRGAVIQVKVLGVMCLIDEGETDWKVLAIDVTDPLASDLNDVDDIEKSMPGFLKATYEWFRYYKVPDGKQENQFAFNGEAKNKAYALKIVTETHEQWEKLMNKMTDAEGIRCENTSVANSPYTITKDEAQAVVNNAPDAGPPAELPSDVDQWHYVTK
ncbi:inorganic pyrophosphatase-like isoform X1 [Octopus vulgaris]|nr:inorganic pyrophosphatase-like isoform X1 [Octopus vulgaris]